MNYELNTMIMQWRQDENAVQLVRVQNTKNIHLDLRYNVRVVSQNK
jgi:hypothetical protein